MIELDVLFVKMHEKRLLEDSRAGLIWLFNSDFDVCKELFPVLHRISFSLASAKSVNLLYFGI